MSLPEHWLRPLGLTGLILALLVGWGSSSGADTTAVPSQTGPAVSGQEDKEREKPPAESTEAEDQKEPEDEAPKDETEAEEDPTGLAKINPLRVHWDEGLHVEGKWDYLHMKIAGDVQNDTAGFVNQDSAEEYLGTAIEGGVEWRRARLYAEGRLLRHLDFKLRYDFTSGNPPNLKDAYFSLVNLPIPTAGFTVGRFRAPLGLDGFTGADDLLFMERSLMSEAFLPSRNTGLMLHGDSPQKRLRWSAALLQPEAEDLALSSTDNLGWSARLAWAFTRGKQGNTLIHLGANFWRRNVSETIQYASQPESNIAPFFVDSGELPAETSDTAVAEVALQTQRLTFEGEVALAKINHENSDSLLFPRSLRAGELVPHRGEETLPDRPSALVRSGPLLLLRSDPA